MADEWEESNTIATEIRRIVAYGGGQLTYNDVAILGKPPTHSAIESEFREGLITSLVRFNALSRPLEQAFRRQGIPCVILGGHKFFDRMEVRTLRHSIDAKQTI